MNECPACGHVLKESKADKSWTEFEYTEDNFRAFLEILKKAFVYLRANELSRGDMPVIQNALHQHRNGKHIPFDLMASFETIRSTMHISICSILEYFHTKKIAPKGSVRIKDTKTYSKFGKTRHFSAHIIVDRGREAKAMEGFNAVIDIQGPLDEILKELFVFLIAGVDKYIDMGKLSSGNFKNTHEAIELLKLVNKKREKEGRRKID